MKPQEHRESCIVTRDTHYEVGEGSNKGTHASSGTLNIGRVVWLQRSLQDIGDEQVVFAYAEGVGIVALDPECLSPTA